MVVLKCVLKKSGAAFAGTVPGITMLVLFVGSLDSLLMVIFMIIFISLIF